MEVAAPNPHPIQARVERFPMHTLVDAPEARGVGEGQLRLAALVVFLHGDFVGFEQSRALRGSLARAAHLAQLHAVALRKHLDGFGERDAVDLLQERKEAPARLATVAKVDFLVRVDVERSRLLLVERTQTDIGTSCFSQADVLADHFDDVGALANFVYVVGRVPRAHEMPRGRNSSS